MIYLRLLGKFVQRWVLLTFLLAFGCMWLIGMSILTGVALWGTPVVMRVISYPDIVSALIVDAMFSFVLAAMLTTAKQVMVGRTVWYK